MVEGERLDNKNPEKYSKTKRKAKKNEERGVEVRLEGRDRQRSAYSDNPPGKAGSRQVGET